MIKRIDNKGWELSTKTQRELENDHKIEAKKHFEFAEKRTIESSYAQETGALTEGESTSSSNWK